MKHAKLFASVAIITVVAAGSPAFGAATDPSGLTLVDLTSPTGNITTSNPSNGANDTGPEKAFSDDSNRFLIYSKDIYKAGGAVDLVYTFETSTLVTSYGIYNHNDSNQDVRPPKTWKFYGSNDFDGTNFDSATWAELDSQSSETGWAASEGRFYYFGDDKGAFKSYKIEITANNVNDYTQFRRIEFYDVDLADAVPISYGEPEVSATYASISVSQPYVLRSEGTITGVKLFTGSAADSLTESEIVPTLADGAASFSFDNLSSYASVFWQLRITVSYFGEEKSWPTEVVESKSHRVVRLNAGSAAYDSDSSWSSGDVPSDECTDVIIDGDGSVDTTVTLNANGKNFTNGFLVVQSGDKLNFLTTYSGGGTTVNWYSSTITNYGGIAWSGNKKNGQNLRMYASRGPLFNGTDAIIEIVNGNYQGCTHQLEAILDGSRNDGSILVDSVGAQYHYSQLKFSGGGKLTNNGTITIRTTGGYSSNKPGSSELAFSGGGDVLLTGTGKILLDEESRASNGTQPAQISGSGFEQLVVNDASHSIVGDGIMQNFRFVNRGLLKSVGTNDYLHVYVWPYRTNKSGVTNEVSGRIVASGKGLYMRYKDRPAWNTRFYHFGLMEARTGSQIRFGSGFNTTSTKTGDSNLEMNSGDKFQMWGRLAGGGYYYNERQIVLESGATLAPGDLANDDGTGESTCGTISFRTNLVLTANAVSEFQFQGADRFDSLHVGGTLKVDGTLKVVGPAKSGTYRMITSDNPIQSDNENFFAAIDMTAAEGSSKPKFSSGSETIEEQVPTGETDAETGEPIMETVSHTVYYVDATFLGGFAIIVR